VNTDWCWGGRQEERFSPTGLSNRGDKKQQGRNGRDPGPGHGGWGRAASGTGEEEEEEWWSGGAGQFGSSSTITANERRNLNAFGVDEVTSRPAHRKHNRRWSLGEGLGRLRRLEAELRRLEAGLGRLVPGEGCGPPSWTLRTPPAPRIPRRGSRSPPGGTTRARRLDAMLQNHYVTESLRYRITTLQNHYITESLRYRIAVHIASAQEHKM